MDFAPPLGMAQVRTQQGVTLGGLDTRQGALPDTGGGGVRNPYGDYDQIDVARTPK